MTTMHQPHRFFLCAVALGAGSLLAALAQAAPAPVRPDAPVGAGAAAAGGSRQSLMAIMADKDRLLYTLGERELDVLLDRAFTNFGIAADSRASYKVMTGLRKLNDPKSKLTMVQRREAVKEVVGGIDRILQTQTDPRKVMELAALLVVNGVMRDLNTLEYWGKDEKTVAQLRPVAEAVSRVYAQASAAASKEADALAAKITDPNDKRLELSDKMLELSGLALYNKAFNDYAVTLCMSDAEKEARDKVVEEAVTALKEYDNPQAGVQNSVRTRIGKLYMAKGDLEEANKWFELVIKDGDWGNAYEARYFRVVSDVQDGKVNEAKKGVTDLEQWQDQNIPADQQGAKDGAKAALRMLEYRVAKAEFARTKDPKAKQRSIDTLMALVKERPDLRKIVFEQILGDLPTNAQVKQLDVLLLRAMVERGEADSRRETKSMKPEDMKKWKESLEQALAAAQEILDRKDPSTSPEDIDSTAYLKGLFLDLVDRDREGADAYMDYIQKYGAKPELRQHALENAGGLLAIIRTTPERNKPEVQKTYERFLDLAVNPPFNYKELSVEYAWMLLRRNQAELTTGKRPFKPEKQQELLQRVEHVLGLLKKVSPDDKQAFNARYLEMMTLVQKLELGSRDINAPDRIATVQHIQEVADELDKAFDKVIPTVTDATTQKNYRLIHVRTALTAAGLAVTEKATATNNPQLGYKLLETFEEDVKPLPQASIDELMPEALNLRFKAYMALNKPDEALAILDKAMATRKPEEKLGDVTKILEQLDEEFKKAQGPDGDKERAGELARNRAKLTGYLRDAAEKSTNPEVVKLRPKYLQLDIDSKQTAARLTDDETIKKQLLAQCLENYKDGYTKAKAQFGNDEHIEVLAWRFKIAGVQFDLGDYAHAQPVFSYLVANSKIGSPKILKPDPTNPSARIEVDNNQYWEVYYKLMRCNAELVKGNASGWSDAEKAKVLAETKKQLENLYFLNSDVGGDAWKDEYDKLRVELMGADWKPPSINDMGATTKPATKP